MVRKIMGKAKSILNAESFLKRRRLYEYNRVMKFFYDNNVKNIHVDEEVSWVDFKCKECGEMVLNGEGFYLIEAGDMSVALCNRCGTIARSAIYKELNIFK